MGIWNWILQKISKAAEIGGWNIKNWQSGRPYYPDVSYGSLISKYQSWVYACADKNAISCAQIPLRLYAAKPARKIKTLWPVKQVTAEVKDYLSNSPTVYKKASGDIEEVTEHPFLDLMDNVNEYMNGFDLKELTFLCQELTGNSYWYLNKSSIGVVQEIWPLFPQFMRIIPSKAKFIERYEYVITETEKEIIEPEFVVHFKYINPKNALYGMGPLEACVVASDLYSNMNIYETSLMLNRATPDFALIVPPEAGTPSESEKKRMYADWRIKRTGIKKAGKLVILTGGADLKEISLSPKEMAFLQGRRATVNEISAVFGVPMSKLTVENVNRANAEAGDYSYMKDTILPRLRKFEQKINEKIMPLYDERLFVAFDNPVPEDREFRLKQAESRLKTGQTTINEERQIDGQESVEWGNVPILPFNMVPLGTQAPTALQEGKQSAVITKSRRKLPPLGHPTNFVNEPLQITIADFYRQLRNLTLGKFDENSEMFTHKTIKSPADDWLSGFFDMQKWSTALAEKTEPFVRYTFLSGANGSLRQLNSERRFDMLNPKAIEAMEIHRVGSLAQIVNTTGSLIRNSVADGMAAGEGAKEIRKRLENRFDFLETTQSERIARTETIWAWNEGAVQGYIQSGIVEKKQWLSSGDPRSCDFCLQMDGKIVGVEGSFFGKGDTFNIGDNALSFDYEDVGHPPLHPNCRCAIVPIVEEI